MKFWKGTRNAEGQRVFYTNEFTVFEIGKEYTHADMDGICHYRVLEKLDVHDYLCQFTNTGETFELINKPWD